MTLPSHTIEVGSRWRNRHTGREATVLAVREVTEAAPHELSQDPRNGRLIFGDFRPVEVTRVFFTGGAPPGYNDEKAGGMLADEWVKHWTLDIGGYGGES